MKHDYLVHHFNNEKFIFTYAPETYVKWLKELISADKKDKVITENGMEWTQEIPNHIHQQLVDAGYINIPKSFKANYISFDVDITREILKYATNKFDSFPDLYKFMLMNKIETGNSYHFHYKEDLAE